MINKPLSEYTCNGKLHHRSLLLEDEVLILSGDGTRAVYYTMTVKEFLRGLIRIRRENKEEFE